MKDYVISKTELTQEQIDYIYEPCTKVIKAQEELLRIREETISLMRDTINALEEQIRMLKILANYKEPLN